MILTGISASPGIAIGEAFVYDKELHIPKFSLSDIQISFEIARFHDALKRAKEEYIALKEKITKDFGEKEAEFLESHILITQDPSLIKEVINKLTKEKMNLEWVLHEVVQSVIKKFSMMDDEYFKERAIDFADIGRKLLQILLSEKNIALAELNKDVIIITDDLSVSDTASMNKQHVLAFVTELGGKTSHASILARSLGIPAVCGVKDITYKVTSGEVVIVDGTEGKVIINPTEAQLEKYTLLKKEYETRESENLVLKDLPAITLDGKRIELKANIELPEQELDLLISHGVDGIGLYRSEFLYLSTHSETLPTEEQQFAAYKYVLEQLQDKPVTIRTLDLGGDKVLKNITEKELNPYLGWRAIRFSLARPDIFKIQLRALIRASLYGNLRIMFPMISGVEEVLLCKKYIEEVKNELMEKGIKFSNNIPIGIMIETPSAVILSDVLAKYVDFFSIGTNDLIQYTLACDRSNSKVAYLYEPLHPAVLRMLKMVIDNAHKNDIPVSLCGEMGGEIEGALVLVGLGVDELSTNLISVLEIKKLIRNIYYEEVKELVNELLLLDTSKDVRKKVNNWLRKKLNFVYH